ncbi:hypothetical protein P171DRAFT_415887, partial [Karstenula rhodostoma CBS 690.94]
MFCGGWASGGCCSQEGFCGSTPAHCAEGCQSGCTTVIGGTTTVVGGTTTGSSTTTITT